MNTVILPNDFIKMNSMPGDPKNSVAYGNLNENFNAFVMTYPIEKEHAMAFNDDKIIIDGIHSALSNIQGLIEVKSGLSDHNNKYSYSIVKTKLEPSGVQYVLTMHIENYGNINCIQAFFDEKGMTGLRDTMILNKMINEGKIDPLEMKGWMRDPYDQSFLNGLLMNLSELTEYDEMFPNHPLSEIRKLIKFIIKNN